jgi:hypothetical protein
MDSSKVMRKLPQFNRVQVILKLIVPEVGFLLAGIYRLWVSLFIIATPAIHTGVFLVLKRGENPYMITPLQTNMPHIKRFSMR